MTQNNVKSKGAYSVSVSQGRVAHEHDDRDYLPKNVDRELMDRNIYIKQTEDYQSAFNDLFMTSIEDYNRKQLREDRKKSFDYYSEIENGKRREKAIYEYVFQIGNSEDLGVTDTSFDVEKWKDLRRRGKFSSASRYMKQHLNQDPRREELKCILTEKMKCLEERYPKFHFWSIIGHDDEPGGTFHFHVAFTPVADGYKNGMNKRDSLTKALNQMDFINDDEGLAISKWQNELKDLIEDAMTESGHSRQNMNNAEAHLSVSQYKLRTKNESLIRENVSLKEKNDSLIKENNSITEENKKLAEKNRCLFESNRFYEKNRETLLLEEKEIKNRSRKLYMAEMDFIYKVQELEERDVGIKAREDEYNTRLKEIMIMKSELDKKEEDLKKREEELSCYDRARRAEKTEEAIDKANNSRYNGRKLPNRFSDYSE